MEESFMQQGSILELRGVTKTYDSAAGPLTVLHQIDLGLLERETCAILGPSGSGKTTLLGLCAGLDLPSTGEVILDGENLGALSEEQRTRMRNRSLSFVFQNFQLLPTLTALENVMVPLELRAEKNPRQLAREMLGKVGLGERLDHYPVQLSGGEQQRVALARAFVTRPKILFADEPTGNLDAETSGRIVELLWELKATSGVTVILVTHDPELAGRADRVIRLRNGRVAEDSRQSARLATAS
jgi:putative ABC transport system ATP-binding protein